MKFLALTTTVAVAMTSTLSAQAVYNLYKKDGLSLDVMGEINVVGTKPSQEFELQYQKPAKVTGIYANINWKTLLEGAQEELTDRRVRLGQDRGASWLEFRGSQRMANDWRVTGTAGFGYYDSSTGMYLNNANLVFDKKNVGAIGLGRQYLHTGYVTRTETYTPLNTFGATSIRADLTAIPNLHMSAYYGFPADDDVRTANDTEIEIKGYGASLSYKVPFGDSSYVRTALGYTKSEYNPIVTAAAKAYSKWRLVNQLPVDTKAAAASLEFALGRFLVAGDYGIKKEDLDGNIIDSAESKMWGAKVGVDITPKWNITAGYGERDVTRQNKENKVVTGGYLSGVTDTNYSNMVLAYESFLFDKVEEKRAFLRSDYLMRENVRFYARMDKTRTQTKLEGQNFAKMDNTEYRAGVSLSF